jgi:Tfp pilus assembly protein PilO
MTRTVEATGLGLVALSFLAFYGVYQPLSTKLSEEARRHADLRQRIRDQQARVDLLTKFVAAMPQTEKGLDSFSADRIAPRRVACSTADHLLHKLADAAGVKVSSILFHFDKEHNDPLERLELQINLAGSYAGLLKFLHAFETANEFILVREAAFAPEGENGALGLRLGADLYLTP